MGVKARAQQNLTKVFDGSGVFSIILTNENTSIPISNQGLALNYTATPSDIYVYSGTSLLKPVASNPEPGEYTITASGENITAGVISYSGNHASIGNASDFVTDKQTYSITFTVSGKDFLGNPFTSQKKQVITALRHGDDATSYWVNTTTSVVMKDVNDVLQPSNVTAYAVSQEGFANATPYKGIFKVYIKAGVAFPTTPAYMSPAPEVSHTVNLDTMMNDIRIDMYSADGSNLLDTQTVPIIAQANGVVSTSIQYTVTDTNVQPTESASWADTIPTVGIGQFLWTKTTFYYTDGSNAVAYSMGHVGKDGASAPLLFLSSDSQTFTFDGAGNPNPANQTINFVANLQNLTGTATFVATPYLDGAAGTPIALGGTGNARSLTIAQFGQVYDSVSVKASLGNLSDTETVYKLKDGADGSQGAQGVPGPKGPDGLTTYVHIAYADSSNGASNFSTTDPNGRAYIGVYTDTAVPDSTDYTKYTWSLIKGADGADGTPGPKGADGRTSYIHVAYANSSEGTSEFSTSDAVGKKYIGVYTDFTVADSNTPSMYTWSLIKGADGANGAQGVPGPKGADGLTTYVHFVYAGNATGTLNFSTTDPSGRPYMGVMTDTTPADSTDPTRYTWSLTQGPQGGVGPTGATGAPGPKGADGLTTYVHIAYANSANGATSFSTTDPTGRAYIGALTDTSVPDSTDYTKYTWSLVKGADGANGAQGVPGPKGADGISTYIHFAYAGSSNGSSNFSTTDSSNRAYIGVYTDTAVPDSTDYTKYTWSLIKGPQGPTGPQGIQGPVGPNGVSTYVHFAYANSADGTVGFSTTANNQTYIGVYTDSTQTGDTTPSRYTWSLMKGADGKNAITGWLTNESITLQADSNGNVPSYTSATGSFVVYNGTNQVTGLTVNQANAIGMTLNISGMNYSVTNMVADIAYADLSVTYSGTTITKRLTLAKSKAGANGANGTSVVNSTTPPSNPTAGQWWNDMSVTPNVLKVYQSGNWIPYRIDAINLVAQSVTTDKLASNVLVASNVTYTNKNGTSTNLQTFDFDGIKTLLADGNGNTYSSLESAVGSTRTVQGIRGDLNNLQVGGRNLYLNSRAVADGYGPNGTVTVTVEPFDSTTNMWHIVAAQGSGTGVGIYLWGYADGKIPNNSDWSYSADIKGTGKVAQFGIEQSNKTPVKGNIGSEWSRISQTGHVAEPNVKTIILYFDARDSPLDIYIKLPKLETGNIPTDWSPAPEDTATQISTIKSLIEQKADSSTIGVIKDDVNSLKSQVNWQQMTFDDMNYLRGTGNYLITGGAHTNAPIYGWFYITVDSPRTDRTTQTAWQDQDNGLVYRRVFDGTNWSTWSQVVSSSTLLNIFHDSWSLGTSTNDGITKQLITGINGQADGTLVISGKSVILDSDTVIGNNFIIGSANIGSLDARKITTGQLSGPSLNIDLDQGNVLFQKGRIYDSKTQIDVNIDQAYIRTTNGGGSATLQNGRLLLTGPVYDNGQTIDSNPYFSISASLLPTFYNQPSGAVGSLLQSKDFSEISISGHGGVGFLASIAAERAAGISISAVTGTYIAGNDRGVTLSGGKDIGGMTFAESPNFVVGYDDSKGVDGKDVGGNSILARANNFVVAANNFSIDKNGNGKVSNSFFARNIGTNGYHTIISQDNGRLYFSGGDNNLIDISVKTVSQSSLVSLKENIRDIGPEYALGEVLKSDVKQYNFIGESKDNIRVSPMIDDVNHELYIPKDWLAEDGKSVENYTITGYLIQSIKALQQQIKELKQG